MDAYSINNDAYFKLCDLAYILHTKASDKQFGIEWDNVTKSINIITSADYTPAGDKLKTELHTGPQAAVANSSDVYLDERKIELTSYSINGNNYFKLRDIASAVNFDVDWDGVSNTIIIDYRCDYTPD